MDVGTRFVFSFLLLSFLVSDQSSMAFQPPKRLQLEGEELVLDGHKAFLFTPKTKSSKPQPWILYAPTLPQYPDEAERWMHEQFVQNGIAVAGIDAGEAYGSPLGNKAIDLLYNELTAKRGFSTKPCLFGRSRGGLWVTSWAIQHPDRVAGIIGIYPVFDLRTYPGLAKASAAFQMTSQELEARLDDFNPAAKLDVLAKHKIPFTIIHGDDDKVVPLAPNSGHMKKIYDEHGVGHLGTVKIAEGQGHNFWEGFFKEPLLVEFAIRASRDASGVQ